MKKPSPFLVARRYVSMPWAERKEEIAQSETGHWFERDFSPRQAGDGKDVVIFPSVWSRWCEAAEPELRDSDPAQPGVRVDHVVGAFGMLRRDMRLGRVQVPGTAPERAALSEAKVAQDKRRVLWIEERMAKSSAIAESLGGKCHSPQFDASVWEASCECALGHRWVQSIASVCKGDWCPTCAEAAGRVLTDRLRNFASERGERLLTDGLIGKKSWVEFGRGRGVRWGAPAALIGEFLDGRMAGDPFPPAAPRAIRSAVLVEKIRGFAAARGERLIQPVVESMGSTVDFERADGSHWSVLALRILAFLDGKVAGDAFPPALPATYAAKAAGDGLAPAALTNKQEGACNTH